MNAHVKIAPPPADTGLSLDKRAMLATVKISMWSARKHDKTATAEVAEKHQAERDAGRYNKRLLSKDALAPVVSTAGAIRQEHYKRTLPWNDDGARILSVTGFMDYTNAMRPLRQAFQAEVERFMDGYDTYREKARKQLGSLFSEADYPDAKLLIRKFGVDLHCTPLPTAKDFRASLPEEQLRVVRADIEKQVQDAMNNGVRDVYGRISGVLEHMVRKLTDYKPSGGTAASRAQGVFRDSLVTNVAEIIDLIPSLNVTNDPGLTAICEEMKSLVSCDARQLREVDALRTSTADKASKILSKVNDYLA